MAALAAFALLTVAASNAWGQSLPAVRFMEKPKLIVGQGSRGPKAILTQLKLQDLFTPSNFQTTAQTNTVQIRPGDTSRAVRQ